MRKSEISLVELNSSTNTFKSFPNPVRDNIIFQFNSSKSGQYVVSIYNMQGKLVRSINSADKGGFTSLNVNTENLQTGMYFTKITLINNGKPEIHTGKIVVQK